MRIFLLFLSCIILLSLSSCEKMNLKPKTELTIRPIGNRGLSEIAIREIDRIEGSKIHFKGGNFADKTEIMGPTTYKLKGGHFYISFRYRNYDTNVGGVFFDKVQIEEGESWTLRYGYNGGKFEKEN